MSEKRRDPEAGHPEAAENEHEKHSNSPARRLEEDQARAPCPNTQARCEDLTCPHRTSDVSAGLEEYVRPRRLEEDPRRAWLEALSFRKRATGMGYFLAAVRAGEKTPAAVLAHVRQALAARAARGNGDPLVSSAVDRDPELALYFASHVLDREKLPRAELDRQKAERAQEARKAFMADLPPTEKQVSFLGALGYQGPRPANRALASSWIDSLARKRRGAP